MAAVVGTVVRARQRDLVDSDQWLAVPPQVPRAIRQLQRVAVPGAEQNPPRTAAEIVDPEVGRRHREIVVALVGEDLQLRGDVILVGRVAIAVVRGEVQQRCRLGRERDRVLKLERRGFADDRRLRRDRARERRRRRADVADDRDRQRRGAVHVADPLGRRRFAVGAGHRDELVRDQPPGELELPDDGYATGSRRHDRGRVLGYAGALDERPGAGGNGIA
jgi:hypothetical protein